MSDEPKSISINQLFQNMARPPDEEIDAFVLYCLNRIKHLIDNESGIRAYQQLSETGKVSPELAEEVNVTSNSLHQQNTNANKAIAHALCHFTEPDSFHYSNNRRENSRLVALYCQWAVSRAEVPSDDVDETYCDDEDDEDDDGVLWLRKQIESREQSAQVDFVRENFPHWIA